MASRIEGFDEKILLAAQKEFLDKGYNEASIRMIAKNAGTSTSAIYTRYIDKEGLFHALVSETTEYLIIMIDQMQSMFQSLDKQEQKEAYKDYPDHGFKHLLDYIYDHYVAFKLLFTCAPENMYKDFLERLVEVDTKHTKNFINLMNGKILESKKLEEGFLHVVSSAFYSGMFEVVIHDMNKEDAIVYMNQLREFYANGWNSIFEKMNI